MYNVVKADTNGDAKLTENDLITIALTDNQGENYTEILLNVQEVLGHKIIDNNLIAIIFKHDDRSYIYHIDMNTYKIIKKNTLPKIPEEL